MNYSTIKPAVLQVELHPQLSQQKLLKYCRMNDIAVTAYSSFGATSFVELGVDAALSPLTLPSILEIAARHSKSAAQVLLRWGV